MSPAPDVVARLVAEPAAGALRDLVVRLDGLDAPALSGFGDRLAAVGAGIDESATALRNARAASADAWQGAGADGFGAWIDGFSRADTGTRDTLERARRALADLVQGLETVGDEVGRQVMRALAAAEAARTTAASAGADRAASDRLAAQALTEPTAAVRTAIAGAESQIGRVAATIAPLAEELQAFRALPVPDDALAASSEPGREAGGVRLSAVHRPTGEPAPSVAQAPPTGGPQGTVGGWIREAVGILAAQGVPADRMDLDDIATIIDRESGGDPNAVNGSDSNAAKGTPSQGLMQTIGPTFRSYRLPGHDDIRNPVDNIIAGVRYAIARYGSVSRVPGVVALAQGRGYVGY